MQSKTIEQLTLLLCLCLSTFLHGQITIDYPREVTIECNGNLIPSQNNALLGYPKVTTSCATGRPDITYEDKETELNKCGGTGVLMRFWTVTDECGGLETLLQRITVEDTTPPEIDCMPTVVIECEASLNPAENPDLGFPTITDCSRESDLTVSYSDRNEGDGICGNLPEKVFRTWTAIDACGNSSSCEQVIQVGVEVLSVSCDPVDFFQDCNGLDGSRFAAESWDLSHMNQLRNCAASECGGIDVVSDFDFGRMTGGCGITGMLEVNYLIKDGCGNTKFKTATFTLRDTTPPESFCDPIDFEVSCEGDATAASRVETWHADNLALIKTCLFDNCGTVTVTSDFNANSFNINNLDFDCNDEVGFPVNYILTDECDNTSVKTVSLKIVDNGAPTFENVPRDTSIGASTNLPVSTPIVIDNCSPNLTPEFEEERIDNTIDDGYQLIRTWTATDDCGNIGTATQNIMVLDPILSLACTSAKAEAVDNKIVISNLLAPNEIVKVFAMDNRIVYNCFRGCGDTQTTRTLAEDVYMVKVEFYTATWQLICSDNISVTIGNGGATTEGEENENGNEDSGNGENENDGNTDPCTASDCETTPPVITTLPSDMTVNSSAVPSPATLKATDNCDTDVAIIFNEVRADGSNANNYVLTRTWTARDDCNNIATAKQVIRVEGGATTDTDTNNDDDDTNTDNNNNNPCTTSDCEKIAPILANVPRDITVDASSVPSVSNGPIATDNCDTSVDVTLNESISESVDANNYVLNRTWTATDDCGNTATAKQVIRVVSQGNSGGEGSNNNGGDNEGETDNNGGDTGNENTIGDCADIKITTGENTFNFSNLNAPNKIVKIFDLAYNVLLECDEDCGTEVSFSYEIAGNYFADVQLYTADWQFICETREAVILGATTDGGETDNNENSGNNDNGNNNEDENTTGDCTDIVITTNENTFNFSNLNAPNKIVKIFDLSYNVVLECDEDCGSEFSFSYEIAGNYFADVQLYTADWAFICETRERVSLNGGTTDNSDNNSGGDNGTDTNEGSNNNDNNGGNSAEDCAAVEIIATQKAIILNNINTNNKIVKVFDENYTDIFNCFTDCEAQITAPISNLGTYLVDIQLYTDSWTLLCEDRRTITVSETNPEDECEGVDCGNDSGNNGSEGNNNDNGTANSLPVCEAIQIETTNTRINLSNLTAPNVIVKAYNKAFDEIFQCFGTCGEETAIKNLSTGNYQVNINFYDENWIEICERIESIVLGSNLVAADAPTRAQERNNAHSIAKGNTQKIDFTLYPNPAANEVLLNLQAFRGEKVQLKIYNQLATELWVQNIEKVSEDTKRINLSNFENGVYILQISLEGQAAITKKLLVNKTQ